jgi:hypothetical protein
MASEPTVNGTAPMDYKEHEATFGLFVRLTEVLTPTFITYVVALAVGWVKTAPFIGSVLIIVATVAAVIGMASKTLSLKLPLAVLGLSLLALLVV